MASKPLAQRVTRGDSIARHHRFDAADIADFAHRSGDRNPVHHDAAAGKASRFGKRIASAEHTISLLLGFAASWLAERGTAIGLGCSFRFTAAVREGDTLELKWVVTQSYPKDSLNGIIVCFEGEATNQDGLVAMRGTLEMLLQE
ncbi:MAG TPA: MaoC family dehydratase [Candidatus Eremiobacteraceae bacterium]|nr:MaoC family dehydratase [Candidatus Eremiobacteraceae bacterium]